MKTNTLPFFFILTAHFAGLICALSSYAQTPSAKSNLSNGLRFTENKGQLADMSGKLRPDVLYKGDGGGADIYLRKTGISYVYSKREDMRNEILDVGKSTPDSNLKLHRVDMDFVNCNHNIRVANEDELAGYNNYYYAHCPKGVTHVKQFNKVIYKNIYDGIDAAFYGEREKGLEYDIIVNAGADLSRLKLNWTGADDIYIKCSGDLVIKTSVNEFYVSIPKAYQRINGIVHPVDVRYALTGGQSHRGQEVVFKVGSYNHSYPVTIDPLTWITYFGGNMEDLGLGVTTDHQHNVLFCGYTESPNLPVSVGAYDVVVGGASDGWIAKFDAGGARLWATYFGGSGKDECRQGIAVDSNNNIFVTSVTFSTDFPTMAWGGAFMQLVNNSPVNGTAYVAQFTPAGTLTWSTYYGGSTNDWGIDITIDALQDIIITGNTSSNNFPVQAAYQPARSGGQDIFIVKFNNQGVRQWATFYGGSNTELAGGITADAGNNIYLSGTTSSANFPAVAAFQGAYGGGVNDAFLVKLNTANGNPLWSTYYGGTGDDQGGDVAADALGNVFLGLKTSSANNISTAGSYQPALKGNYDGGLVKFTNAGTRVWGTYIGGNQSDGITGVAVDMNNNISVGGSTQSTNFPVTACAFETTFGGTGDMIVAKFNQPGQLLCSTFIHNCGAFTIAVDGLFAYMIGGVNNVNLPITAGAFQTVYGGVGDAVFAKLCSYSCDTTRGTGALANFTAVPASPCLAVPVNFTLTSNACDTVNTTYLWTFPGGTPAASTLQNPGGIAWGTSGTYGVSVQIVSPCDSAVTVTKNVMVNASTLTISAGGPATFCYGDYVILSASAATNYLWSNGATTQSITVFTSGNYSVRDTGNACSGTSDTITVTVNPVPPTPGISIHHDTLYCSTDTSYISYQWYDDTTLVPGATNTFFAFTHNGNYNIKVTNSFGCLIAVGINLVGIKEIYADNNLFITPNPATNQLTIHSDSFHNEAVILSIMNMLGQEASPPAHLHVEKGDASIDVSKLPAGMYFLQLKSERGSMVKKFVKE